MSNRLTLLLITQSQLVRVDLAGGKSPRANGVWSRDRIPGESIATLTDAAIRLGPKKTGDVWVFTSEFWTGVVHLDGDVSAALDADELDQAIALEAETFSGISAFDSRLGLKALPKDVGGEARWWVTQIPQRDWQEVNQVVQQFRGKLAGMGHAALPAIPASFRRDGSVSGPEYWRLNQAFGESTISINGVDEGISELITFGDLKTQRTQTQLLEWFDETAHPERTCAWVSEQPLPNELIDRPCPQLLLTGDAVDQAIPTESGDEIAGDSAFQSWAEAMAACMRTQGNGNARMPIAVAHKPPMSSQAATLIACALGLIVALGCFGLHTATGKQLTDLDSQISHFNRTKKALASDKQKLQALEKELTKKRETLSEIQAKNHNLTNNFSKAVQLRKFQQTRWVKLVSALARANEGDCWVRALECHGTVVKIQGMAVSNQEISVFATNLEKYASPYGWRVHPAQTERNDMALVDFEVTLDVSDRVVPDPEVGSSVARSCGAISFVTAPIQNAQAENRQ